MREQPNLDDLPAVEAWRRPPTWLYLPSQGILGHGLGVFADREERLRPAWHDTRQLHLHGGVGASSAGAGNAIIRGRSSAPGREERRPARGEEQLDRPSYDQRAANAGCADVTKDNGANRGRQTRDRFASIRRSLDDHAERVMRKRQREAEMGSREKESATVRLAAVRERVLARCSNAGSRHSDGQAVGEEAGGMAARSTSTSPPESKEDYKIHLFGEAGRCEDRENAVGAGGDSTCAVEEEDGTAGGSCAWVPIAQAVAAEASRVAWHAAASDELTER